MIGSHNSLTCFLPNSWWAKPFTFIWKCQDMSFPEQLEKVDYFDIRVRYKHGLLTFCHGLVDLKIPYSSSIFPEIYRSGKKCRVIVERGTEGSILHDLSYWIDKGMVDLVVIKKGWKVLYSTSKQPYMIDYTYIPFHSDKPWWRQLGSLKLSTPRRWARKSNPLITDIMRKDETIHFMDYVKIDNSYENYR